MNIQERKKRIAIILLLAFVCMNLFPSIGIGSKFALSGNITTAQAAEVTIAPGSFCMVSDAQNIQNGQMITITGDKREIGLAHSSGSIPSDAKVIWQPYDENVINVVYTSNYKATVTAVGPGYAQLAAVVTYEGMDYQVYCQIYVPLEIDLNRNSSSGNLGLVKNLSFGDAANNIGYQLLYDGTTNDYTHYLVKLKNIAYQDGVTNMTPASSSGITVHTPALTWKSSNDTVVKVDQNGIMTAMGSGFASITVETTTTYQGKTDKLTFPVYVKPTGQLSTSSAGLTDYFDFTATSNSFTINTNATKSSNLTWTIHKGNSINGDKINLTTSNLMKMTLSDYSGSATFTNVRSGTYYITARPSKDLNEDNSYIEALEFKVVVPVFFGHTNITMNVGDYYDILANSNLPNSSWYTFVTGNGNIASVTTKEGVITANGSGTTTIQMNATAAGVEGGATNQTLDVKVIDGFGLNMDDATIYVGAKVKLELKHSNVSAPVIWKSSDEKIAKVDEEGYITGIKVGDCKITAEQVVDGVTKYLTCNIRVIPTVTNITLDPQSANISIGDFLTINATVEPKINNLKLHWITSDESVVTIESAGNLSSTVKGVGGGVAVITAINQDNIVVGSCKITVFQPIEKITLSETSVTVPLSAKWFQLYATIEPYAAKDQDIIWQSSNNTILTVDSTGKVTLKKAGTASIIVTSKVNANITATCSVTISKSVTGISLDYTNKDMYVGETFRLTYVIKPSDSSILAVEWSSSNTSVAQVDASGLVSAKGVGSTVIILKTKDGGYVATCTIKVSRTATAVKLDVTELTLNVNDYYYLESTLTPKDATETVLSWDTSDKKIATVSKSGKVIAKGPGKAIIMVKTKSGSTGYCTVRVLQPVTGIEISSKAESITVGDEIELSAEVLPAEASDDGFTWESSDTDVATVNDKGNVVGVGGGVAMISVTSNEGDYKDYCMVTVEELVTSIKLNRSWYRLGKGSTYRLIATINGARATNKQLEWSSSNEKVATVDAYGRVKGIKNGWAIITATATDGSDAETSCKIRVCTLVNNITVDVNYLSLTQGHSYKLKTKVTPSNATYKTPTYTSDNEDIAIVSPNGTITALAPGVCVITAKAKDSSAMKAICYVTVNPPISSTGVSISEGDVVMSPGETKTVAISIVPNNSTDTIIWSSDNPVVATVNAKTGKITAKGIGTANITVMTESGRKGTIKVYVVGLSKTSITLPQYTSTLLNLEVYGTGTSNLKVRWDVDNQEVATVANGKVVGKALGITNVYAIVNGRRLTCKVTVVKIPSSKN